MKRDKRKNIKEADMTLAEFLRQLRIDAGYKQKEIAEILGVKSVTCSAYESGRIAPTTEKLVTLAKFYGVDLSLFTEKMGNATGDTLDFSEKEIVDSLKGKKMSNLRELDEARDYLAKADELLYYFKNLSSNQRDMVFDLVKALYLDKSV